MLTNKEKPLYSKNIAFLRNRQCLTVKQASKLSGISIPSWRSYEHGQANPPLKYLPLICEAVKFYDVIALVTKDLANDSTALKVDVGKAKKALSDLISYLEEEK